MDSHKFAFIICTNNEIFLNECLLYIDRLLVPDSYTVDVITITDAACMTEGYEEGRQATDAQYKIYMHQDVFIINRYFLYDLLSVFAEDSRIKMIGMIGYPYVAQTGYMWDAKRLGTIPVYGSEKKYPEADAAGYRYSLKDGYADAALIDGLLMATSADIPWNTKRLRHWDFYDAYQSIAYLEQGYRIVVPTQTLPWIIHDDGFVLWLQNYEKYRQYFLEDYPQYLGKTHEEIRALSKEKRGKD